MIWEEESTVCDPPAGSPVPDDPIPGSSAPQRMGQSIRKGTCMPQVTRLRVVCAAVAAGALTLGTLASATAAQAANPRSAIAHTHPSWAVAAHRVSSEATTGTVSAHVYLAPQDQAGLAAYATAVSTPG